MAHGDVVHTVTRTRRIECTVGLCKYEFVIELINVAEGGNGPAKSLGDVNELDHGLIRYRERPGIQFAQRPPRCGHHHYVSPGEGRIRAAIRLPNLYVGDKFSGK